MTQRRPQRSERLTHVLGAALHDGVAEHLLEHVLPEDGHLLREEPQLGGGEGRVCLCVFVESVMDGGFGCGEAVVVDGSSRVGGWGVGLGLTCKREREGRSGGLPTYPAGVGGEVRLLEDCRQGPGQRRGERAAGQDGAGA